MPNTMVLQPCLECLPHKLGAIVRCEHSGKTTSSEYVGQVVNDRLGSCGPDGYSFRPPYSVINTSEQKFKTPHCPLQ